jgi:hypothetical protein
MTFDEWFVEYNKTYGLPPAYTVAQQAWNAAIEAAFDAIHEDRKYMTTTATLLAALKTPL